MSLDLKLNILLIEDDAAIAKVVQLELEHQGNRVSVASDGISGLNRALQEDWDVILLDVMLPHLNGYDICKRVRSQKETPILLLTAKDEVQDVVFGLDLGADDYLTKPFAMEELLARLRAVWRRRNPAERAVQPLKFDAITLDPQAHQVWCFGEAVSLTKKEFDLLVFFLEHPNHVLTREQILENVWGTDYFGDTNVVDVYVRFLRGKIDERFQVHYLHTVRGVGYALRHEA